jgi:archaellum component FlaC
MKTLAHLASALLAAATFVLPLSAMAETKAPAAHHHAKKESVFPMKADTFKKLVDGNIEKMKGHFERGAKKRSLSHEQKAEIDKSLDSALKDLHAAVDKVSSDGVVTKDESKQIKDLTEQLRGKVRDELRGKHANAKAKGQKSGKKAGKKASKKHEPKADKN